MAVQENLESLGVESPPIAARLARYVSELDYTKLPDSVAAKVRLCLYDAFAGAYAGHELDWSRAAVDTAAELAGRPEATIWTNGARVGVAEAAFANGVAAHSVIGEDMHTESQAHAGTVVFPTLLAVVERDGASGRDVIAAAAAGYELIGRVGRAVVGPEFRERGFRPSGTFGPLGAAAAASRLLRIDAVQTLNAVAIAANFAGGLNEWGNVGSTDVYAHNGQAARSGILAALLARRGLEGPSTVFEGRDGFAKAYGGESAVGRLPAMTERLGEQYEIMKVWHKPAPACAFTQTTAQVALGLARREGIRPQAVRSGVIRTFRMGNEYPGLDNAGPFDSILAAKMSNQFAVAATIVHGEIAHDHYRHYDDPRVRDVADRLAVEIDSEADAGFPARQMVKLELLMEDGTFLTAEQRDVKPPSADELVARFRRYAEPVLGADETARLTQTIDRLDALEDARDLIPRFSSRLSRDSARPHSARGR
jgi:2-methylcitrate dehydratase PrpD